MNEPGDDCDRSDMVRLAAGNESALGNLMERHGEKLFHYLIRCLQNEEDAADLAQETFVRVYQNRHRFNPKHSFSTWLYSISTNLVRDRYRWRARHPQISLDAARDDRRESFREQLPDLNLIPSQSLDAAERAEVIREAVSKLPEELRTPLILAEYEEKSQAEIAAILDCTAKAVETRIYRARKQLREMLERVLEKGS